MKNWKTYLAMLLLDKFDAEQTCWFHCSMHLILHGRSADGLSGPQPAQAKQSKFQNIWEAAFHWLRGSGRQSVHPAHLQQNQNGPDVEQGTTQLPEN